MFFCFFLVDVFFDARNLPKFGTVGNLGDFFWCLILRRKFIQVNYTHEFFIVFFRGDGWVETCWIKHLYTWTFKGVPIKRGTIWHPFEGAGISGIHHIDLNFSKIPPDLKPGQLDSSKYRGVKLVPLLWSKIP